MTRTRTLLAITLCIALFAVMLGVTATPAQAYYDAYGNWVYGRGYVRTYNGNTWNGNYHPQYRQYYVRQHNYYPPTPPTVYYPPVIHPGFNLYIR